MYAVIDAETTGLSLNDDRIVELAVIGVAPNGEREWEWCSLINPERDTGSGLVRQVHQIYPTDVENAPTFYDFAGDIARMLDGRVVIAHNAQFDLGMLGAEFGRLGHQVPDVPRICTATIARDAGFRPYRLDACCEALCIELDGMHHALADARATIQLAQQLVDFTDATFHQQVESHLRSGIAWPRLAGTGARPVTRRMLPVRKREADSRADTDQARKAAQRAGSADTRPIIESFSVDKDSAESKYLAAVEWALEDREIPQEQREAIDELRADLGLSDEEVHDIHMAFIRGLAGSMWQDGVISNHEQFDLDLVGELLQLTAEDIEYARDNPIGLGLVNEDHVLEPGDKVVFTGEMSIPRSEWKERAKAAGLRVTESVSKKTDYLVVPFGQTGSSKSRKARDLCVRVVSEQRFRRMMDRLETPR